MTNPPPDKADEGRNNVAAPHQLLTLKGLKKYMDKILTAYFKRMEIERKHYEERK